MILLINYINNKKIYFSDNHQFLSGGFLDGAATSAAAGALRRQRGVGKSAPTSSWWRGSERPTLIWWTHRWNSVLNLKS